MRGWRRNFATLWVSQFVAMVAFSAVLPFLPLYVQYLGVRDPRQAAVWAGLLGSSSAVTMALMAPVWGALADRYGRKLMVQRALFGGGTVVGLMGLVSDVFQLLVLRIIQGGVSGTVTAARVLAASIVPASHLGMAMGLMQTAIFVGSSAGPLLGGFIADHLGFRAAFFTTAGLLLATGLAVMVLVHEEFQPSTVQKAQKRLRDDLRWLLAMRPLVALIVVLYAVQVGTMVVSPILPLFIQSLTGPGQPAAAIAGTIIGATAASSALASVVAGRLGDRIGHRRVLTVCAMGAALLYAPQALVATPGQLLVLRVLMGLFMGGVLPSAMAMIGLLTPAENRGWVYGLTASASSLGNATGPLLGALVAASLDLRAVFLVTAGVLLGVAVWVASVVPEAVALSAHTARS